MSYALDHKGADDSQNWTLVEVEFKTATTRSFTRL